MARLLKRTRQKRQENKDEIAKKEVLNELFYDIYRKRGRIYQINFVRGIYFGLGSALGGTVILALLIGALTIFIQIPGGIGDFIRWVIDTISQR